MKKGALIIAIILMASSLALPLVLAHVGDAQEESERSFFLNERTSITVMWINSIIIIVAVALSIFLARKLPQPKYEKLKPLLFLIIVLPTAIATFYMIAQTITINVKSESGGPVHWHADYEMYACGQEIDLIKPSGFSNRIGSSTFHDHGDNRIHLEGTIISLSEITLGKFFEIVGGELHETHWKVPVQDGFAEFDNGDLCSDGSPGFMQAFLYKTNPTTDTYTLEKLNDFENYLLSPHSNIPPGDCLIFEFGPEMETTDHICNTYRIDIEKGKITLAN